jgi:hypothetical protein
VWGFCNLGGQLSRIALGKKSRFAIFHRDGFTCQYCGTQPPDCILVVDHVRPVIEGGTNDPMNLVTSCVACNAGKGRALLEKPQRPDADLAWVESQQEVAELMQYQRSVAERDRVISEIVVYIQSRWKEQAASVGWIPSASLLKRALGKYDPRIVEDAILTVAVKCQDGYLPVTGDAWVQYLWGTMRKMEEQRNATLS